MYLRKCLPPHQKEIFDHALEQNVVATTNNCTAKTFPKDPAGKFNNVAANSKKAVDANKKKRAKKIRGSQMFL